MSIWKMCQDYLKERRQKGQIIVFTAVLLPFIIAMCGLTVDFGNMYVHKSKLQNAADAAAIAGAYAYAENGENKDQHPNANDAADDSIEINYSNHSNITREFKARTANNKDYFRVVLREDVPIYFLRLFNVGNTAEVAADAVASIESTGGNSGGDSIFNNLFSFGGGGFNSTNNGQNPDNPNNRIDPNHIATYDGNIVNIGQDTGSATYRHKLLTSQAREEASKGNIISTTDAINAGYYTEVTTDKTKSLDEQLATIRDKAKTDGSRQDKMNDIPLSKYLQQANGNDYIYNTSENFELKVDSTYMQQNANNNNPLYVVVDIAPTPWNAWAGCKLKPEVTYQNGYETSRPIVFVYTGKGEVTIDPVSNSFFRGIIYAPYGSVKINDNGLTFRGSIVANSISLSSVGHYTWEPIISGGGSSGSGSSSGSTSVGLVSPPSDINWND